MPGMPFFATLSKRFLITLPKAVCAEQKWKAGQKFVLVPKDKGLLVIPAPELNELAGIARGACKDGYRDR